MIYFHDQAQHQRQQDTSIKYLLPIAFLDQDDDIRPSLLGRLLPTSISLPGSGCPNGFGFANPNITGFSHLTRYIKPNPHSAQNGSYLFFIGSGGSVVSEAGGDRYTGQGRSGRA